MYFIPYVIEESEIIIKLPLLTLIGGIIMFHKAVEMKYLDGTNLELRFQDGIVKQYDVAVLFFKYPQLKALEDRNLFISGKLISPYGIKWTDELDLETETVYEEGVTVAKNEPIDNSVGSALQAARAHLGISQKQLSVLSGIDQSDISKTERGVANPSVSTLERLAQALGGKLQIRFNIPAAS